MSNIIQHTLAIHAEIAEIKKLVPNLRNEETHGVNELLKEIAKKLLLDIKKDPSYDEATRQKINSTITRLLTLLEEDAEHSAQNGKHPIPSKEVHYNRNQLMPPDILPISPQEARQWGWSDKVASDCHQFTSPDKSHVKFVSPNGKYEVIFDADGNVVTAPEDYGTYNFADPETDPIGHFYEDVLPWLMWGNSEDDSTDPQQRLRAFVVLGGANALLNKIDAKNNTDNTTEITTEIPTVIL